MKLPYVLIADNDVDHRDLFAAEFDRQVAYAAVSMVDDGRTLLSFLSACDWKGLPNLIVCNLRLPDMTAPDLLRELLLDTRYLNIPKLVWMPEWDAKKMDECRMLGVKHFLKRADSILELSSNIRKIDDLLKTELDLL